MATGIKLIEIETNSLFLEKRSSKTVKTLTTKAQTISL